MSMSQVLNTAAANLGFARFTLPVAAEMVDRRLASAWPSNIAVRRYETAPNTSRTSDFCRLVENSTKSTSNERSPCYLCARKNA